MSRVLVFGCGPAGLMATQAAAANGHDVIVVSKKRKSEMFGCQYLHRPIPGVTRDDSVHVSYELRGTEEGYRKKVYGPQRVTTSPESLETSHMAWDLRDTYDTLWLMYGRYVQDEVVSPTALRDIFNHYKPDITFSTLPAPALCMEPTLHTFSSQMVWAIGDAPERGIFAPNPLGLNENMIVCNGEPDVAWYRSANVFGYHTLEYSALLRKPPINGIAAVDKPLKTNCDCWPQVKRLGRFGKWQKGVLSHEAYEDAKRVLSATGHQDPLW